MPEIFDSTELMIEDTFTSSISKEALLESVKTKRAEQKSMHKRTVDEYSEVLTGLKSDYSPFAAYSAMPHRTSFSTQAKDEKILLLLRKHPLTQLKWIFIAILIASIPIIFSGVPLIGFLPANFQFAGVFGWYLLLTGFIIESFLTWYFNVYIVTDERIIDVDFLSLIYHDVASAKIDKIEDVTAIQGGAIRSVFDYGTVQIQTAAERTEFEFEDVPHPTLVTKLLNELLLEEEREKIEGRVS